LFRGLPLPEAGVSLADDVRSWLNASTDLLGKSSTLAFHTTET